MKVRFVFALLSIMSFILPITVLSQEYPLLIKTETKANNSVDFFYTKTDPGNYLVSITLNSLSNCYTTAQKFINANGYSGKLLTLTPDKADQGIGYGYKYTIIRGIFKPKIDTNFVYILPFRKGSSVYVAELGYLKSAFFGASTPSDWKSYRFSTEKEDTVLAARKGIVVDIVDKYESEMGYAFTSKRNVITIEHPDGTIVYYNGLKKGNILVKIGQTVYPGSRLGVNSQYNKDSKFDIDFTIVYLKSKDLENANEAKFETEKGYYGFVTPKFYVHDKGVVNLKSTQQAYIVSSTPDLINRELTKKELKQASLKN